MLGAALTGCGGGPSGPRQGAGQARLAGPAASGPATASTQASPSPSASPASYT
ncbi:polysaccharide deacetylase, partial [Streptomyces sp. WAC07061]